MGEAALYEAVRKGFPLVEVVVRFTEGIDYAAATERLNALADDFHLDARPWYDKAYLRIGSATREALERLFGWHLVRTPIPSHPESYCWSEVSGVARHPIDGLIESISMSQPGADDDGQWYPCA